MEPKKEANDTKPEQGPDPKERARTYESAYRPPPQGMYYYPPPRKLYRSTRSKWLGGVCGGIAEYFNRDPLLIRLLWIVLILASAGVGIIAYLIFWAMVDKAPAPYGYPVRVSGQQKEDSVHYHYHY